LFVGYCEYVYGGVGDTVGTKLLNRARARPRARKATLRWRLASTQHVVSIEERSLLCVYYCRTPLFEHEHEHEHDSVLLGRLLFFLNGFWSGGYQHGFGLAGGEDAS
jgi:hypothetical protein